MDSGFRTLENGDTSAIGRKIPGIVSVGRGASTKSGELASVPFDRVEGSEDKLRTVRSSLSDGTQGRRGARTAQRMDGTGGPRLVPIVAVLRLLAPASVQLELRNQLPASKSGRASRRCLGLCEGPLD